MAKKTKVISVDIPREQIDIIYHSLTPLTWIVNFFNGTSDSSKNNESFLDLDDEKRRDIVAFRFLVENNKFTMTKKIGPKEYIKGVFYHIKEGRDTVFGQFMGLKIPYFAERIGFVYNQMGDAYVIRIDHGGYLREVRKRIKKVEDTLNVPIAMKITDKVLEKYKDKCLRILNSPITYKINVEIYKENIFTKGSMIALSQFGTLDDLPVDSQVTPRIYENTSEVTVIVDKKRIPKLEPVN